MFCNTTKQTVLLLFVAVSTMDALSTPKPSDRILSQEYYKSAYKNINTDQPQRLEASTTGNDGADLIDTTPKVGGRTPWDLGNSRPQPAIVRAYKEGKIRGNVLDAGCGIGENCIFLADKYGVQSVTGFDLSEDAIEYANKAVDSIAEEHEGQSPFWTRPKFLAASCTEVADRHRESLVSGIVKDSGIDNGNDRQLFDVVIDSGLLHCLSNEDAKKYVNEISKLLQPNTGRFFIGCFSTANPDPWDNPRRISEEYLRDVLFSNNQKWEVLSCRDCWWARPPTRGSSTGGAFSLALWVEVRCLVPDEDD
jgi:SAM-dependent methyltransferase